jgi:hypothetical protein
MHGERVAARAIVMQQKTQRPVQFEITEQTRESLAAWIRNRGLKQEDFLFPSRLCILNRRNYLIELHLITFLKRQMTGLYSTRKIIFHTQSPWTSVSI